MNPTNLGKTAAAVGWVGWLLLLSLKRKPCACPSLFLFLFFRTPELAFSFTKSFVSGPSASQFSFRAEMAFNPPFLQFACEISQKNLATYSIASFHILVAWESIKSQ